MQNRHYVQAVDFAREAISIDPQSWNAYAILGVNQLRIGEIEAVSPKGKEMYIQVIADPKETWPLPFYLREFPNTGYWVDASTVPTSPQPDILISSADFESAPDAYLSEFYGLRPDTLLAIHIRRPLWERFIETRK